LEDAVQRIVKLFSRAKPADVCLRVQPIPGGFGVYGDTVLIAIHSDQASADAHYQRLLTQQAEG
jgi:hypothetical protein